MTYDEETKRKALEMIASGASLRAVAQKLKVSHTIVAKWDIEDKEKKEAVTWPKEVFEGRVPQPIAPSSPTVGVKELVRMYEGLYNVQAELSEKFDDLKENLSLEKRFIKLEKQLAVLNQKVEDLYRLAMGKNKTE